MTMPVTSELRAEIGQLETLLSWKRSLLRQLEQGGIDRAPCRSCGSDPAAEETGADVCHYCGERYDPDVREKEPGVALCHDCGRAVHNRNGLCPMCDEKLTLAWVPQCDRCQAREWEYFHSTNERRCRGCGRWWTPGSC